MSPMTSSQRSDRRNQLLESSTSQRFVDPKVDRVTLRCTRDTSSGTCYSLRADLEGVEINSKGGT